MCVCVCVCVWSVCDNFCSEPWSRDGAYDNPIKISGFNSKSFPVKAKESITSSPKPYLLFSFVGLTRYHSTFYLFNLKQHQAPVKPWRKQIDTISWSIMPSPYWREDRNIKPPLTTTPRRRNDIWTSIHGPHPSNVTVKAILISTQIKDTTGNNLNIRAEVSRPNHEWCLSPCIITLQPYILNRFIEYKFQTFAHWIFLICIFFLSPYHIFFLHIISLLI